MKEKDRESVFLKPTFSKAVAGFIAPCDEAGYGFRKSRISKIGFGWVNEYEPEF